MFRMTPEAVVSFLSQTPLLRPCGTAVLAKLAPHLEQREVPRGQALLQAGVASPSVGFLVAGRASLRCKDPTTGSEDQLDQLGPGDTLGEMCHGLASGGPLSIVAEETCNVLFIRKEHLDQVMGAVPGVAQALAATVSARFVKVVGSVRAAASAAGRAPAGDGIRFVEVSAYEKTKSLLDLVPARVCLSHRLLPLELDGNRLLVGMVNPKLDDALTELRRVLNAVEPEVACISIDDFNTAVIRLKLDAGDRPGAAGRGRDQPQRLVYLSEARKEGDKAQVVMGEEVTLLVDRILLEAVERGASDVHIEAETSGLRVRYRVQGMMVERKELVPASFATGVTARLKILSELDITERRIPQDGRIAASVGKRDLNFRISTLATCRGEKVVLRILDPTDVMRPLDHIFVEPRVLELVKRAVAVPHGAILVAGPTGSGKSSTLYSMLNQRKTSRPDNNIVTVEDPVEFMFPGLTQTPINPKVGLDYATALRALLRQDPDVIMVGELRDGPSTGIAIEAALTGHLVLSSMHGNTGVAVLQRLGHFGIPPVLLSQALNIIVVQRLAPRLCQACVTEDEVPAGMLGDLRRLGLAAPAPDKLPVSATMIRNLDRLHLLDGGGGAVRLPRPVGCDACEKTGRKGRVPVVEVLALHDDMRAVLAAGVPPAELLKQAEAAGQFISFTQYAQKLMARKLLAPSDAVHIVAE
jgi:type IV pilus assembly protein PilB